jgi:alkylmercury lyase-like protein
VHELDRQVRNHVYRRFVELGRAPRFDELADELGLAAEEVDAAMRRLHEAHALVLERDGSRIRMANPFSAMPTPHRVEAQARWWYANCAWDAFGILAALDADGRVSSSCPDCAEPIEIEVRGGAPAADGHVAHINVPAARWWDDIVFT